MKKQAIAIALVAAFGIPATAHAQDTTTKPSATAQESKVDRDTKQFFEKAAQGGMAEVELGKLATDKAASSEVRQFGEMMVKDHGKANEQLMKIASQHGITPPSKLEGKHKKTEDKLSKLSGPQFDRAYMDHMVKDHKEDIELFEKQAKNGKNADVKQFAEQTLPTLREHLKQAQQIQKTLQNGGKGTS